MGTTDIYHSLIKIRDSISSLYQTLSKSEFITSAMRNATSALRNNQRILYLGSNYSGQVGVIDSSECPPTFGAEFRDVQSYLYEGWKCLGVDEDSLPDERMYKIGYDYFKSSIEVQEFDFVVGLSINGDLPEEIQSFLIEDLQCEKVVINVHDLEQDGLVLDNVKVLNIPVNQSFLTSVIALKLTVNLISTSAHVFIGKVFSNRMVDLKLSNTKLVTRAAVTLSKILNISYDEARQFVLQSVYEGNYQFDPSKSDLDHVDAAAGRQFIVPKAILLGLGFSYSEAESVVLKSVDSGEPIRSVIASRL
ncbi:hypothetical protein GEMRC1_003195 [Eukaryota sp. GEM-RC1]